MVFVNNQKFACESCIKGHRSSSCHHTDRPLFEVKRKGRPVTQCETCRELRKSKKIHAKCICDNPAKPERPVTRPLTTKYKRHIPLVPTLPNGLKDVLEEMAAQPITVPPNARSQVNSLLNPCTCRNTWRCKCPKEAPLPLGNLSSTSRSPSCACASGGCSSSCCGNEEETSSSCCSRNQEDVTSSLSPSPPASCCGKERPSKGPKRASCCSGSRKAKKGRKRSPSPPVKLPPLHLPIVTSDTDLLLPPSPSPEPIMMPPISTIESLAGSGCTCGVLCACPGCREHRGDQIAAESGRKDCTEGCGHCVNHSELGLPGSEKSSLFDTNTIMDMFFKTAASLPEPPTNWKQKQRGVEIDPRDVSVVYPGAASGEGKDGNGFQLVKLPKLECCGGKCGCANGQCACGTNCDGCCEHHQPSEDDASSRGRSRSLGLIWSPVPGPSGEGGTGSGGEVKRHSCCSA